MLARERGDLALVLRIAVGVHEDDRDGLDAVGARALEVGADRARDRARASTVPSARTRSSTSITRSNSISGLMMWRAKIFGRAW